MIKRALSRIEILFDLFILIILSNFTRQYYENRPIKTGKNRHGNKKDIGYTT